MTEPLHRKALSLQVADRLEAEIRDGIWTGTLPGYRTLADHFGTSRKTCRAALEILEQRRAIAPASQGSKRRILAPTPTATPKSRPAIKSGRKALLIVASSDSPISDEDWHALRLYSDCWIRTSSETVSMVHVDYGRHRHPQTILESLAETHRAGAMLIHLAPQAWVRAAAEITPIYLMGGEQAGIACSGDSFSLQSEVTKALKDLQSFGHHRVLLPVEPHLSVFRERILAAGQEVFGSSLTRGLISELCPVFAENVPEVWQDYWLRAFSKTAPTAVILLKDAHLLSLYGFCAARRIEIPRDLSVVYLGYSDRLEWCHPRPCQMRFPMKRAMAHFRDWIRGGLRPLGMKHFSLEKVEGSSVGSPPRSKHPPKP